MHEPSEAGDNALSEEQAVGVSGWYGFGITRLAAATDRLVLTMDPSGDQGDDTDFLRAATAAGVWHAIPATDDRQASGELSVRGVPDRRAQIEVRWHLGDGTVDTSSGEVALTDDDWTRLTHISAAPYGTEAVSLGVRIEGARSGDVFEVSQAALALTETTAAAPPDERDPLPPDGEREPHEPAAMDLPADGQVPEILLDPEAFGFPGPNTTGVTDPELLEVVDDRITIDEDGQVLENKLIRGHVYVIARDATIRNVRIETSHEWGIHIDSGRGGGGLLIEDTEIVGQGETCLGGVAHGSYTAQRVEVSNCEDGFRFGSDTTIEDSFVHSLRKSAGDEHNDAAQTTGGNNVRIRNNTLVSVWERQTSAILLQAILDRIDDVEITGNLMSGGSFTLYVEGVNGQPGPTNVLVRDNVFVDDSWQYGHYRTQGDPEVAWRDNRTESGRDLDAHSG